MEHPVDSPAPSRIVVHLPPGIGERLVELARSQLRHPRDQAAVLIMDGLEAAGIYDRTPARRPAEAKR